MSRPNGSKPSSISSSSSTLAPPPAYNTHTPGDKDIPRFVTYTSPVAIAPSKEGSARASTLPLNLIAHIVSFLDDIADIARVTRTSKLLYYMTVPQLYAKVSLHSYPEIRYVNGRPEGFGSGSPFMLALNGLVTKSHANLVQELRIWGEWNELSVEDFAKGRVPDNNMMLNILVRASVDRMSKLQTFAWELDCKPLKTLYQGLGAHNTLTTLKIKFPKSRLPRPSVMIPPMANLRAFHAMDIDPLCYPDDMSVMLLQSKKLEDLRIHFSPRMRQEAESSLNLNNFFGRCLSAGYKLRLKHFALQNFYGTGSQGVANVLDHEFCTSLTALDMFGGLQGSSANVFLDDTWKDVTTDVKTHFKRQRCNEPAAQHVTLLCNAAVGMERFYMVNAKQPRTGHTPTSPATTVPTPGKSPPDPESTALGKQYLYALTRYHGPSLKHLLLSEQWQLSEDDISDLVRHCPNLEQLGMSISSELCTLRLLLPFLTKLQALRVYGGNENVPDLVWGEKSQSTIDEIGYSMERDGAKHFRWFGLGERVFRVGGRVQDEKGKWKKEVKEMSLEDVRHVEIWGLDELDIALDPVNPFSP